MTSFKNDRLVKRAISHLRLGNPLEAKRLLAAHVQSNPEDVTAWLWLAKCVDTEDQVRWCLEKIVSLDGRHSEAKAALRRLRNGKDPFPGLIKQRQRREARNLPQKRCKDEVKNRKALVFVGIFIVALLITLEAALSSRRFQGSVINVGQEPAAETEVMLATNAKVAGSAENILPIVATETPDSRMQAAAWKKWPTVPEVSARTKEIYLKGQMTENDPTAFSVIGDCHSAPDVLFGRLSDPEFELLAEYGEYLETISFYSESWERDFVTVKNGMSAASVLSPYWSDEERCDVDETPLACEIRLHHPSIIIISIGTNWLEEEYQPFEEYYRRILDEIIKAGIVPVITTKADPTASDFPLNQIMVQLAYEYDVPLWNFWAAVQGLPDHGLDVDYEEGHHLLHEAWDVKRLTGVQVLDAVRKAVVLADNPQE